ncbi:MAG: helix-turn-helix domain-containing protein [Pseudonocardiaceae bacterium]|nr:helix-turn-helix domain-containing protein [Pseudonocardiaceae bacterium]
MESRRQGGAPVTAVIAERVKALRTDARLSGPALAAAMNEHGIPWNRTTLAKLETGRRETVTVPEFLALALVLDVPPVLLLADPRRNGTVPVAEGLELGPWEVLLWLVGEGTITGSPRNTVAMDLITEGRIAAEMAGNLRHRQRFMGTEEEAARKQDELHRSHLETMREALLRIEELGATVPQMGPHVLQRAAELDVKLPGQNGEG